MRRRCRAYICLQWLEFYASYVNRKLYSVVFNWYIFHDDAPSNNRVMGVGSALWLRPMILLIQQMLSGEESNWRY